MGHLMRLKLTHEGLLVSLANHYTTQDNLVEEQLWYCSTHTWRNKRWVHAFPKGLHPKVNLIAQLKFKLSYFDDAMGTE